MGVRGRIGEFQPFAELNRGQITIVYKAYQESLNRVVLLKVLRSDYSHIADIVEQFEEEARLVAQIQHPNVVTIHSYGRDDDRSFFAAEYVEGMDLSTLLAQAGPLPLELATYILSEVAKGLQAAHRRDILHRDIKPGNIMIGYDGQVKLTDFGMASLVPAEGEEGKVRGTPGYMAPEQLSRELTTQASDLFSLGVVAYEMIAGRRAFPGDSLSESIDAVLNRDPFPALDFVRPVPDGLKEILRRLLAKDTEDRWNTVDSLIEVIEDFREFRALSAGTDELACYIEDPGSYTPEDRVPDRVSENGGAERVDDHTDDDHTWRTASAAVWRSGVHRKGVLAAFVVLLAITGYILIERYSGFTASETLQGRTVVLPDSLLPADSTSNGTAARFLPVVDNRMWAFVPDEAASQTRSPTTPARAGAGITQRPAARDSTGSLMVQATADAVVYVDGDSVGQTPFEDPVELVPGEYELVVRHPEFSEYRDSVTVADREETEVDAALEALVGSLDIRVSPWAEIAIDGVVRDTIPPQRPFLLAPGYHVITLRHPEYGVRDTLLQITAGEDHRIEFSFQKPSD